MQLFGRPGLWVSRGWGPGWSPRTCPGGSECALWLLPRTERTGCRLHVAARTPAAVKCRVRGFGPRWARRFRQCPVLSGSILGSCLLLCRLSKLGGKANRGGRFGEWGLQAVQKRARREQSSGLGVHLGSVGALRAAPAGVCWQEDVWAFTGNPGAEGGGFKMGKRGLRSAGRVGWTHSARILH